MTFSFIFFFNSVLLGIGLAMDAFSVSLADGLNEPKMSRKKTGVIAGVFAGFQALMPMLGWICVHTILQYFQMIEKFVPVIGFLLLVFIGGKMLIEGVRSKDIEEEKSATGIKILLIQGVATSIDALSVGFTIADYGALEAVICALIIAAVTFVICIAGFKIGKKFGTKLSDKAQVLGGVILIIIGLEILLTSL